jgi:Carbohydrate binding module (family 6)/Secretion system C-terminal sorting domain
VASLFGGAQFQLRKSDGTVLTTVTVPNTGSFQTWQTVSASVTLPAGQQTLRIYTVKASGGWNLNWWDIAGASSTTTTSNTSSSIHIEAEDFSNQYGIQTEPTSDAGGGKNVGYQDDNDWMDYSVNVSSAGTYTVNFRVASLFGGAQFQLRKSDGTVLTTVTVPSTGGYQVWQTLSASVSLPAGQQTLRIYTVKASGGWNINWWEIMAQGSATSTIKTASIGDVMITDSTSDASITVFPNPATDRFALKINNSIKGQMTVRIVNISGQQVKQFILTKQNAGVIQFYLSIGDLQKGEYIINVQMKDWTKSVKMIKE